MITHDEAIEIIRAHQQGKVVQFWDNIDYAWSDWPDESLPEIGACEEWRVKPKGKTMSEHTPGPWRTGARLKLGGRHICEIVADKSMIGAIYGAHGTAPTANAKLMAAAPDLLEACEIALARFEVEQSFGPHRRSLYKAIRKAKGQDDE